MKTIYALFKKDLRVFWKDKLAVVVSFLVPMVLILIFGLIFGGSGSSGPSGVRLIVVDENGGAEAQKMIEALEEEPTFRLICKVQVSTESEEWEPITAERGRKLLKDNAGTYRYLLVFPENFVKKDFGFNIRFIYNPQNSVENNIVQGILQKVFFSNAMPLLMENMQNDLEAEMGEGAADEFQRDMAGVIGDYFDVDVDDVYNQMQEGNFWNGADAQENPDGEDGGGASDFLSGMVDFEKEKVFGKGKNPAAQSVGGWAVMFLLFAMTGAASALFDEKKAGLFQRLLSGPVSRDHILWSKFLFCGALGFSQMIVLVAFGHIIFRVVDSPSQLLPLLLISLVTAAASTSFGMLLSAISKTPAQANGLGTVFILSMSALGGAMFPAFMLPIFIREFISPFTIVYWAMDGFLAVLWRDAGVVQILPQIGILLAIAAVVQGIAMWRYRTGDLFR
jgi:ABC-2 type transport system permease protein